jgi:hypothetical protein
MIANEVHLVSELAKLVLGVSSGVGLLLGLLWVVARAIDENKPFARRTSHEPPMTNNPPDSASVAPRRQTRFAQITSPDAVGAGTHPEEGPLGAADANVRGHVARLTASRRAELLRTLEAPVAYRGELLGALTQRPEYAPIAAQIVSADANEAVRQTLLRAIRNTGLPSSPYP